MPTKIGTFEISAGQSAKYAAAIDDCLSKIDQALERSKHEHQEIARLKKQSRTRLARWKAQFS